MCDDAAVRWSEWEAERSRIESQVKDEISKKLLENLTILEDSGYPEIFLQGFSTARNLIFSSSLGQTFNNPQHVQLSLFD